MEFNIYIIQSSGNAVKIHPGEPIKALTHQDAMEELIARFPTIYNDGDRFFVQRSGSPNYPLVPFTLRRPPVPSLQVVKGHQS